MGPYFCDKAGGFRWWRLPIRGRGGGDGGKFLNLFVNSFLMRKKLSDITNSSHHLQEQQKPPEDTTSSNSADKDCIQQLLKERMTLLKLLAEKNKIIEWTKAEMQMLRGNVQKLQLQNWNLAQSNTHMLAAEASGKFQMAIEKMVEGRLRKYFEEVVLMEQKFIVNDTMNAKTAVLDNLSKEVGSLVRVVSAVVLPIC
ncbi:Elongation factor Ts [Arachis hypogaea]|nr:Elongation factor Ts [Arachis hypogaea]